MYDFDNNQDQNLQRIINFYSLLWNLHDFPENYSPDYILEKWEHWIGNDVAMVVPGIQPTNFIYDFAKFCGKWQITDDIELCNKIAPIFYFMIPMENFAMRDNIRDFKHFGGDLRRICCRKKTGLHELLRQEMVRYLGLNTKNIEGFLRDMIIEDIMEEES